MLESLNIYLSTLNFEASELHLNRSREHYPSTVMDCFEVSANILLIGRIIRGNASSNRTVCPERGELWKGHWVCGTIAQYNSSRKFNYLLSTLIHNIDTIISLNGILVLQSLIIGSVEWINYEYNMLTSYATGFAVVSTLILLNFIHTT